MYDSNKIANICNDQFITNIQTINDEFKNQQQITYQIEIPNSNNSIYIETTIRWVDDLRVMLLNIILSI